MLNCTPVATRTREVQDASYWLLNNTKVEGTKKNYPFKILLPQKIRVFVLNVLQNISPRHPLFSNLFSIPFHIHITRRFIHFHF